MANEKHVHERTSCETHFQFILLGERPFTHRAFKRLDTCTMKLKAQKIGITVFNSSLTKNQFKYYEFRALVLIHHLK